MSVLINPIISEKTTALASEGCYTFRVKNNVNKFEIKKTVEDSYKVNVVRVNLIAVHPKKRVFRGKIGFKKGYKKALVYLKKGDKIELT